MSDSCQPLRILEPAISHATPSSLRLPRLKVTLHTANQRGLPNSHARGNI